MSGGEAVREQFSALQKQQKDRLHQLQEKSTKKKPATVDASVSMNLEVDAGPFPIGENNNLIASIIAGQQESQNEQIRELRDENGRLRKLLAEKDYEIGYLRRIQEEERQAFTGANAIGGDAIATKVVELSKKNRELCAEVESERAKLKKLSIKCKELESMNHNAQVDVQRASTIVEENKTEKELKELRDKFKDLQARYTEAKSHLDITKQELKKIQKALEKEVGDSANIPAILNGTSNWRGRQQQIIALQEKLNELKARTMINSTTGFNDDWEGHSLGTKYDETMSIAQQRHRDEIRRIERERKDILEQQKQEVQTLRNEQQTWKDKFEQSKTRNTVLSNEVKTLREQLKTSLDKSKHDDELVDVLLKQQQQTKINQEQLQKEFDLKNKINTESEQTQKLDQMKQANMIKQLQLILDQKEMKIRELQMHLDENRIEYDKDDDHSSIPLPKVDDSLAFVNITSRHTPIQSITVAPMQLTTLKQSSSTIDPVVTRLERNGFTTSSTSRPPSAVNSKRSSDEKDLKCLNAALETERNRLVDFIQTLQKRLDNTNAQLIEQESKLMEQRKLNVRLERDMEKTKLDLNNVKNRTVKGRGAVPSAPKSASGQTENRETIEELQMRLTLKTEENDGLKNALKCMLDAKEEDLKLYNETIQSVKDIFLQGIQHYKPFQTATGQ